MRRLRVRGIDEVRKRVQLQVAGFNLGLLMRKLLGVGTPRGLQGAKTALRTAVAAAVELRGACGRLLVGRERWGWRQSAIPMDRCAA